MANVYVKPGKDAQGQPFKIRNPHRDYAVMPPEGGWVPEDDFWMRRLRDGDAVLTDPPADPETDDPKPEPRRSKR